MNVESEFQNIFVGELEMYTNVFNINTLKNLYIYIVPQEKESCSRSGHRFH